MGAGFWVGFSLFCFVALLFKFGLHKKIFLHLDQKSQDIFDSIEQAEKLKNDADSLLKQQNERYSVLQQEIEDINKKAHNTAASILEKAHEKKKVILSKKQSILESKTKALNSEIYQSVFNNILSQFQENFNFYNKEISKKDNIYTKNITKMIVDSSLL